MMMLVMMKTRRLLFIVATATTCSSAAAAATANCISDLDVIASTEAALSAAHEDTLRTYVLCPNSVFDLDATTFDANGNAVIEHATLMLGRSNVHVVCGADGDARNNCTMRGGSTQVTFDDVFGTGRAVRNVVLQGITFEAAALTAVWAENVGDLVLRDCVFRNMSGMAAVYATDPHGRRRRRRRQRQRQLHHDPADTLVDDVDGTATHQSSAGEPVAVPYDDGALHVLIDECVFENNTVPACGSFCDGLVHVLGSDDSNVASREHVQVAIQHSVVASTQLADHDTDLLPFLVLNWGGTLTMSNNCFMGNDERLAEVVVAEQGALKVDTTFVQRTRPNKSRFGCAFVTQITSGSLDGNLDAVTAQCHNNNDDDVLATCTASSLQRVTDLPCLGSLDDMYYNELRLQDGDWEHLRTYLLCPHTNYSFSVQKEQDLTGLAPSTLPLVVNYPNIRVLCGARGQSDGACVLQGGQVQLGVFDEFDHDDQSQVPPAATNVLVQGVTFMHADTVNVLGAYPGAVELKDCVFQSNANLASIILERPPDEQHRSLLDYQVSAPSPGEYRPLDLQLTLTDCVFAGNTVGSIEDRRSSGLVTNFKASVTLQNCTFSGNSNAMRQNFIGFLVGSFDGDLTMMGNCFDANNEYTLSAVISQGGNIDLQSNYGPKREKDFACAFVAPNTDVSTPTDTSAALASSAFDASSTNLDWDEPTVGAATSSWSAVSLQCVGFEGDTCPDRGRRGNPAAPTPVEVSSAIQQVPIVRAASLLLVAAVTDMMM